MRKKYDSKGGKRRSMKKKVSILLAFGMAVGLLGCGKGGSSSYDADNFMTAEEAEAAGNPYQIVKNKITLKIFVPRGASNPEYSEMRMFQVLSELTNLDFEFIEAPTDQYETLRSVAWEDKNNIPDLFLYNNPISEVVTFSENGILTPFNDPEYSKGDLKIGSLIDNYMPNYKALVENNFGIKGVNASDVLTMEDGLMYSTASVNDVPRDLTFKYYVNQKWIDNINSNYITEEDKKLPNAADIKTIDEYLTVLRAFKEYDANLNGDANDEVPVTAESMYYIRNLILSSYGYVSDWIEINNDESSFVCVPSTEAYKKYLETASMMYQEGLIDNSTFSNNFTMLANKGFEDRLGSFSCSAAYFVVGDVLDADYVTVGPFTSDYYTGEPLAYSLETINATGAIIPSGTPYVREIARLLDVMYSELGTQLQAFGEEGTDWEWTDDTKTEWKKLVPEGSSESDTELKRASLTPNYGLGVGPYISFDFIGKEVEGYTSYLNEISARYAPYLKEPIPAYIHLTEKEYQAESLHGTTLRNYIEESEFQFITGVMKVNDDWEKYLSKLESYKYKEIEKIYNDALARYKEGK